MPLLDLHKLTAGLPQGWAGFLRDWDRSLRAGNYPQTTRYNYLLAAAQLGRYLGEHSPDPEAAEAADDPCVVTRAHVEAFQAWMIDTRSASTALNKHKGLQQFSPGGSSAYAFAEPVLRTSMYPYEGSASSGGVLPWKTRTKPAAVKRSSISRAESQYRSKSMPRLPTRLPGPLRCPVPSPCLNAATR